ncbi:hypothetical protein KSP39_PZI022773 [Platanthera zijinensis]|uniref:Uncharacterized protein n=1 Tax=Platanthera zijinensis TaxID=2320716 RepID=A0AAP0FV23_9ASPA
MPLACYYDSDDSDDFESYVSPPPRYSNVHSSRELDYLHRPSYVSPTTHYSHESRRVSRPAYDSYSPSSITYSRESRRVPSHAYDTYSPSSTKYPSSRHSNHRSHFHHDTYYDHLTPRDSHIIEQKLKRQAMEEERKEKAEKDYAIWADSVKSWYENDARVRLEQQRRSAVIWIQSHIRGFLQRRSLQRMTTSTIIIQSHMRRFWQMQFYLRMRRATFTIQRHIRQWFLRRRTSSLLVDVSFCEPSRRALSPLDLVSRFGHTLLLSSARDPFLMFDHALEGKSVGLDMRPDWTGHGDDYLLQFDQIDGDPVFYPILRSRPLPKPPKGSVDIVCSSVRPASEAGTARPMISDSGTQCRPPAKPPWKP